MSCLLLVLAIVLAGPVEAGASRVAYARYSVRGPLESFELDGGRAGSTIVELELGADETLEVELPVPVLTEPLPGFPAPAALEGSLPAGAQVRFEGWDGPRATRIRDAWRRVPRALTARSRPPVRERQPAAGGFELAVLAAAGLLGLGLRRRPVLACGVGIVAAAVLLLRGASGPEPSTVAVLEGQGNGEWIEVVGRWGVARLDAGEAGARLLRVETSPPDAALRIHVDLTRGGAGERLETDAVVFVLRRPGAAAALVQGRNAYSVAGAHWAAGNFPESGAAELERRFRAIVPGIWYRSGQGLWTAQPEHELQGAPPGWLASGLPQGVGVLLFEGTGGRFLRETGLQNPPAWVGELGPRPGQ